MQDKQNKQVKDDDDELLQELETNEPFQKKKKSSPQLSQPSQTSFLSLVVEQTV